MNLTGAIFTNADLPDATFTETNLTGANLTGIKPNYLKTSHSQAGLSFSSNIFCNIIMDSTLQERIKNRDKNDFSCFKETKKNR